MKLLPIPILGLCVISFGSLADGIGPYQILYGDRGIETKLLSIALAPLDHDVRFSIVLTDKETGAQRRHEFDAPVPEVPEPFHMQESYYCGAPVILLSVESRLAHLPTQGSEDGSAGAASAGAVVEAVACGLPADAR